ncbi:pentatricopeptide repeat-containing protein At2g37230 isoform X2 [Amborella trichopoda]|uniref:pentatricopeptide repeat-containing protein At2g37230 isoform X2 n=1 Tax=Amborella trichopoda TaxID=13333 RepID=UPI0009C103F6|nr:pentatricopeptide repeat-containing protein At2g37230 isoform X2 [Amborella trichopoda]|eukprot:XP_020524373.1 pentatricopeptide repeat-containing protein At2g37230 isoform X2 [Amborella trichopoda]
MASISSSTTQSSIKILRQKTSPWRSSFFHHPLRAFFTNPPAKSSENETPPIDGEPISNQSHEFYGEPDQSSRSSSERGKPRNPEYLEETIIRMMAKRSWTTRLQNSIRALVPEFTKPLVLNILDGAKKAQQALNFFRWVEKTGFHHDYSTHLKIIEILGRFGMLNHARCILFAMREKGVEWDERLFNMLINSYGNAGIVQESVKIFNKMKELGIDPTVRSYNNFFSVILKRGRTFMAKRVGDMENALKSFNELNEKGMAPDEITYTHLIKGFVGAGRIEEALDFFREMGGLKLKSNALIYQALVLGLYENGKMDDAQTLLKEMMKRNFRPSDPSIFLTVMKAQCDVGNLDEAMDILKGMKNLRISPESAHYGVLIEGHCNKGLHDKAGKLLDEVMEDGILLNPGGSPLEPSVYNPIIRYLCEIGHTQKAELFFRQLMKLGVQDPLSFNNLIAGHSRERMPEHGFELLKIMARRGIPSDSNAYSSLVESYLKICEPADAKTALDSMIESGHLPSPSLFRSVMDSLFSDGRVQTASRVMYTMLDKDVLENLDLVAKILEALLLRGHVEEALGRIDLMLRKGCYPDFNHLLTTLCKKEKTIAALKLLDYCLERDCNVNFSSYDLVLDALISAGKTLNAYSILCKITEKGGMKKPTSFESLIKTLSEEGNTKQADILSRLVAQKTSGARKGQKVAMST